MQPRRSLALVAGALVLALPLLSSCGFGKATDKVYTPGVGVNNRDGDVKVLAAVIVAAQPGSGTFIASLSNNSSTDDATFESLAGGEGNTVTTGDIDPPVEIAPRGFVNLADEGGVSVSGDFGAGDVIPLTLSFADGDTVVLRVPVVYACDEYADLDTSTDAEDTSSESPTESSSETPSEIPTPTSDVSDTASAVPTGAPYDCDSTDRQAE